MTQSSLKIEWDAHEYEHKERSADWFWAVGILTISLAVASIIFGNIIFAILLLLSAFSLALFINRPPATIHVVLDDTGITRNKVKYFYSTIHGFWIDSEHPHPKIILRSRKLLMPLVIIPIEFDADVERLRTALDHYLPEEYMRLPLTEILLEYLGF